MSTTELNVTGDALSTPQEIFDATYITASEICKYMNIERSTLGYARKNGRLPNPIQIPGINAFIWERDKVTPYLEAWKLYREGNQRGIMK